MTNFQNPTIAFLQRIDFSSFWNDPDIPRLWAVLLATISYMIWHFPIDSSWAPIEEWGIHPVCHTHTKLTEAAFLLAEKINSIINDPNVNGNQLIAWLGYLSEYIRWLRRLNYCFSFVLDHLDNINHDTFDLYNSNHNQCVSVTNRLISYCRIIEDRLGISIENSAI